jgi:hypothetical protein
MNKTENTFVDWLIHHVDQRGAQLLDCLETELYPLAENILGTYYYFLVIM